MTATILTAILYTVIIVLAALWHRRRVREAERRGRLQGRADAATGGSAYGSTVTGIRMVAPTDDRRTHD
jgi:hypothetical protein